MSILGASNPAPGTGKSLNYIGSDPDLFCFAYSGVIGSSSSLAVLLEFTSGAGFIDANALFGLVSGPASGVNYYFDIEMDGEVINRQFLSKPYDSRQPSDSDNLHFIIPPYTKCRFTGNAVSGDKDFCVMLKGRVYQ